MNVNSDQVTDCVSNSAQPKTELLPIKLELHNWQHVRETDLELKNKLFWQIKKILIFIYVPLT